MPITPIRRYRYLRIDKQTRVAEEISRDEMLSLISASYFNIEQLVSEMEAQALDTGVSNPVITAFSEWLVESVE